MVVNPLYYGYYGLFRLFKSYIYYDTNLITPLPLFDCANRLVLYAPSTRGFFERSLYFFPSLAQATLSMLFMDRKKNRVLIDENVTSCRKSPLSRGALALPCVLV